MPTRRHRRPPLRSLALVLSLALLTLQQGCVKRFDPAAAPTISAKNPQVAGSFEGCKELFGGAHLAKADGCFARFVELNAKEPLARSAQLYRGRIALAQGSAKQAKDKLAALYAELSALPTTTPGRQSLLDSTAYYLGLASARQGAHRKAISLLAPLASKVDAASFPALGAALGQSREALKQLAKAALVWQRVHDVSDRPVEKLHARLSLRRIVDALRDKALSKLLSTSPTTSLLRALCARRLLDEARARGDLAAEAALIATYADSLRRHELLEPTPTAARVGLLLPTRGPYRQVGTLALAGAAVAAGAFSPDKRPLELIHRDATAPGAAQELLRDVRVSALIGVFEPRRAARVARQAAAAGVPFVTLAGGLGGNSRWILRVAPSLFARIDALVQRRVAQVPRPKVVLLTPEGRFGQLARSTVARSLQRRGGKLLRTLRYPPRTRSFVPLAKRLAAVSGVDTVFVVDRARRLALIAPALAQAGLWSRPQGARAPRGSRAIALLATAEGASQRLLRSAGRYLQGALLAPGFYPDEEAPKGPGPLLRNFRQAAGRAPGLVDALAYDAVVAVRAALQAGARTPAAIRAQLSKNDPQGLTGTLRFDAAGRRATPPALYQVVGKRLKAL